MIEVFKVALVQRLLFLSMDMIYSTMEGIIRVAAGLRPDTWELHYSDWDYIKYASPMSLPACTMALGG